MRKLDLRHVGSILGLPLYVDLSSIRLEDQRNRKEAMIGEILFKLIMGKPKPKDIPPLENQIDIEEALKELNQ